METVDQRQRININRSTTSSPQRAWSTKESSSKNERDKIRGFAQWLLQQNSMETRGDTLCTISKGPNSWITVTVTVTLKPLTQHKAIYKEQLIVTASTSTPSTASNASHSSIRIAVRARRSNKKWNEIKTKHSVRSAEHSKGGVVRRGPFWSPSALSNGSEPKLFPLRTVSLRTIPQSDRLRVIHSVKT